ncbi:hypothetical protein [Streptomyces sp. NPDC090022]
MFRTTLQQLLGAVAVTLLAALGTVAIGESAPRAELAAAAPLPGDTEWG